MFSNSYPLRFIFQISFNFMNVASVVIAARTLENINSVRISLYESFFSMWPGN